MLHLVAIPYQPQGASGLSMTLLSGKLSPGARHEVAHIHASARAIVRDVLPRLHRDGARQVTGSFCGGARQIDFETDPSVGSAACDGSGDSSCSC